MTKKKRNKIKFDMSELSEITDELVIINRDFYTKEVRAHQSSLRFAIPKEIIINLDLHAGDKCYFVKYSEGFYISFKVKPEGFTKAQIKERNLIKSGMYDTLYLVIPPYIRNLYLDPIKYIQLTHTKGFQPHEWLIKPLFIDYTCENN